MEIILEYAIIDNFCIDWILLYISLKAVKYPICRKRAALSCSLGTFFACLSPVLPLAGVVAVFIKVLIAYLMCFLVCTNVRGSLRLLCVFMGFTFCFGGLLIALFSFLNIPTQVGLTYTYISAIPIGGVLLIAMAFYWIVCKLIKGLNKKSYTELIDLDILLKNKVKRVTGLIDTGNLLHSTKGRSVVVICEDLLKNWLNDEERMALFFKKFDKLSLSNIEQISVNSMGTNYSMTIFDADIVVNRKNQPISLGISMRKLGRSEYKAIVGKEILEVCNV